jgi:hypothetical protein
MSLGLPPVLAFLAGLVGGVAGGTAAEVSDEHNVSVC